MAVPLKQEPGVKGAAGMGETDVVPADAQEHAHHNPLLRQQGACPDGVVGQEEARQELGVVAHGRAVVRAQQPTKRQTLRPVGSLCRARPAARAAGHCLG